MMKVNAELSPLIVLLFATTIATGCNEQNSKWVEFSYDGLGSVYYDPKSVHRTGDIATAWYMSSNLAGDGYSFKVEVEYDCKNKASHVIYAMGFSEPMGEGRLVALKDERVRIIEFREVFNGIPKYLKPESRTAKIFLDSNDGSGVTRITIYSSSDDWEKENPIPHSFGEHQWKLACPE